MTYPLDPYQRRYSTEYDSHPKSPQTSISPIRPNPNMTRHESFLYPNTYDRPQPPPLRSSHSSYNPRGGPGYSPEIPTEGYRKRQSISDRVELEELTTKGRKRKRLAKACSACHKNKRRCDGFAPCSNCEFSSRPCLYVNAQGEPIPPPRTRENGLGPSVPTPSERIANGVGSRAMSGQNSGHSLALPETRREDEREKIKEVWEVVEEDSSLSAELIDIFFRSSAPFGSMFHPPTFHHRLYLSKTSPLLLDAIYAYSARICTSPALVACYKDEPSWQRGEVFAGRAHKRAESVVAAQRVRMFRRAGGSEDGEEGRDAWTDLEEIQAFTILSIYFACLRQPTLALFYLDTAITLLRPILSAPTEDKTLEESRNRTFWLISLHDLCAAANGRPRRVEEREMAGVGLPGIESDWVRYGGREGKKGTLRLGGGEEGEVGELGHVLRILAIFSDIMTVANGNGSRAVRSADLYQHQDALKTWAQTLPSHLKFNEPNLSLAVTRLSSTLPQIALTGWAFGYMHAVAECGMFYLQAAVALQPGNSFTAQRQSQAVDNIAVVLDALGEKGREGPMMIFPIAVVSNWQDHMRSTTPIPSAAHLALDDRLKIWWAEAKQQWGMERAQVLDRGFYPGAQGRTATSESKYSPPSASYRIQNLLEPVENGLGLYSANNSPILPTDTPVLHGSTDTISTNTTHLPTPFTSRAGLPSLPPLPNRPRATSSTIPYKSRRSSSPDGLPFADGNRTLPPLRRRPEEVPRTIREDPFSPNLKKYDEGRKWSWINTDLGFKEDNNEKEGPVGIAALVSAAESEMEREKSGSWEGVIA